MWKRRPLDIEENWLCQSRNRYPRHSLVIHKCANKAFAKKLATDLRGVGILSWLDDSNLPPGKSLTDAIEEGISQSVASAGKCRQAPGATSAPMVLVQTRRLAEESQGGIRQSHRTVGRQGEQRDPQLRRLPPQQE
jgi:hypothetical protein